LQQILFKIVLSLRSHSITQPNENIMKSRTNNGVENRLRKVKDEAKKRLQKPMRDPTLEGRDENRVGRIPEKFAAVEWEPPLEVK
jgi:hypothetical protein